jgi:hypothetical protein
MVAPLQSLNPDLEALLRPFLDQSMPLTWVVAIGVGRLLEENGEDFDGAARVPACNDAVLLQLVTDRDAGLAIIARKPIPPRRGGPTGGSIDTLNGLARRARDLLNAASGNLLILLPERLLNEMIGPFEADFGFRGIVTLPSQGNDQPDGGKAWKVQRTLFDRGLVCIGSVQLSDGEARCFLASEAVRSLRSLRPRPRGRVTMSSLGTNGRFANQLFQYAYVKLYALRHGLNAVIPAWDGRQLFGLDDPFCKGTTLPELRFGAFTDDDRLLWDMDDPPIDIDLWGYFQEIPKCWEQHRSLLRRMFTLSKEFDGGIDAWLRDVTLGGQRTLVAVHVRRADYRDYQRPDQPWFWLVPEQWYLAWLRAIWPTLREPLLYVATDEPDAILPIFREFTPISATLVATVQALPDHIRDFEILRRADWLAICNSSFSRMASILARSTQKCFYPSFQIQGFVPYEPWVDPGFWSRFADGKTPPSKRSRRPSLMRAARSITRSLTCKVVIPWGICRAAARRLSEILFDR